MQAPPDLLDAPMQASRQAGPLQRQLLQRLKQSILDGRLTAGARLPASRELAAELGISRNTVLIAYEHLAAEGYVVADRQGTRVAPLSGRAATGAAAEPAATRLARRVAELVPPYAAGEAEMPLRPGTPALARFPLAAWRRSLERAWRTAPPGALGYGDPAGEPALRAAIAQHVGVSRGVRCDAAQVVITEGAQDALNLCVKLLADPGDTAWVEDPGYRGARSALRAADLRVVPVPVDPDGLAADEALWRRAPPRVVYVSPSHQYPTGAVLSAARRLDLIARAAACGAWILEDDYDSEFRHQGEPIAAMQGLAPHAPVLYVGTFSKTMFPALRLGFAVLPPQVARQARGALGELLRGGHRLEQLALADFIDTGQFVRHLGRMRRLYRQRQQALRDALAAHLDVPHDVLGGRGGMHLTLRLPPRYPDHAIAAAARRHGMAPVPLSAFAAAPGSQHNGLVLGYGNTPAEQYPALIARLAQVIRQAG